MLWMLGFIVGIFVLLYSFTTQVESKQFELWKAFDGAQKLKNRLMTRVSKMLKCKGFIVCIRLLTLNKKRFLKKLLWEFADSMLWMPGFIVGIFVLLLLIRTLVSPPEGKTFIYIISIIIWYSFLLQMSLIVCNGQFTLY